MTYHKLILIIALAVISIRSWAQPQVSNVFNDDLDYYMFPIKPYQSNTLAGTMGELRSRHFHAGLDIRTDGRTGLPVYAAADGYLFRISISAGGYGKAIYLKHPNGETTVYGHLQEFNGAIAEYTKKEQYKAQQLHVKLYPPSDSLKIKKGDIIAYSGNSGSSAGPHLHFEIRDKDQNILNPLSYGFQEITDYLPPVIKKLAVTPQNIHSRINGEFERKEFKTRRISNNSYYLDDTVRVFGAVGFEMLAYDKLKHDEYECGIVETIFFIDDQFVFSQRIDTLKFSKQRNILTHYNYPVKQYSNDVFQKLYRSPGNKLDIYATNETNGLFYFEENCIFMGKIEAIDSYGNLSTLSFPIKCEKMPASNSITKFSTIKRLNNFLIINRPTVNNDEIDNRIEFITSSGKHMVSPAYETNSHTTYLWDLNDGLPSQIDICDSLLFTDFKINIPNEHEYNYYENGMQITFGKRSLFDTLHFSTKIIVDSVNHIVVYRIGDPSFDPLRSSIKVKLNDLIPPDSIEKKHVYRTVEGHYSFIGGKWKDNSVEFFTNSFGEYVVLTDSIAPNIRPLSLYKNKLRFLITDDLSGIKEFSVFIDDEWILMDYDFKTSAMWSVDPITSNNVLTIARVKLEDNAGNTFVKEYNIHQ